MDALKQSDKTEKELQRRILATYSSALTTITKNLAEFRTKMEQVENGTIKPPAFYSTPEAVEKWKQGFVTQLMRKYKIQETIMEEINRAGAEASEQIRESMADVYMDNLGEAQTLIEAGASRAGVNASFAMPKREEVRVILDDSQGTFSKIAYHNLGQNETVRKRLQSELAQATVLGESQRKIMARIRNVTGQSMKQAKRVAQTERTRVQSQARWNAAQEAARQGVQTYNEWRCRFVNSRDAHMERHGKRVLQGQTFPDSVMRYPGDPNGSAEEVINCHCYLQVGVLLHGETLDSDGNIVKAESLQSTNESDTIKVPKKTLAGVEQGEPMDFWEADNHHVNPNYGTDEGYSINCQTCVVAFEARLRGYDVEATPRTKGSANEKLSHNTRLAWIDPTTGEHPSYIADSRANTPLRFYKFLDETIKDGERYTLQFTWKGHKTHGHIVNIMRTDSGHLKIEDSQRGKYEKDSWFGKEAIVDYLKDVRFAHPSRNQWYYPSLLRIDNMDFDEAMANQILKKAGT